MNGYIGITSREWFQFISANNIHSEINFWRKNTNQFKVLKQGEPFFFLVKNEKGIKTEREVLGVATYERFEVNSVDEAWEKYREGNGDLEKESYIARMEAMFNTDLKTSEIGCVILSNFKVFRQPVKLVQSISIFKTVSFLARQLQVMKLKKSKMLDLKHIAMSFEN